MNFLKNFAKGLLWVLLIPFICVGIVLVALYGIFNFVIQLVLLLKNFFTGKKLFPPFEEDIKAYKILKKAYDTQMGIKEEPKQEPQKTVYIQQNYYQTPPTQPQQPQQNPQFQQSLPQRPTLIIDSTAQEALPNNNYGQLPNNQSTPPQIGQQTPEIDIDLTEFTQYPINRNNGGENND